MKGVAQEEVQEGRERRCGAAGVRAWVSREVAANHSQVSVREAVDEGATGKPIHGAWSESKEKTLRSPIPGDCGLDQGSGSQTGAGTRLT